MKPHLRVERREAQAARQRLRAAGALDHDYRALHEGRHVLWPLRGAVEGEIVQRPGRRARRTGDYRQALPRELRELVPRAFDVVGRVALLRLPADLEPRAAEVGAALLARHPHLRTVALDRGVAGAYRVRQLTVVAGEPGLVARHREHGLRFEVDLAQAYFSPRLAGERARVAALVQKGERALDLFAGVAPFAVALAKAGARVVAVDANPAAARWAARNLALNRVAERVRFVTGRAEAVLPALGRFERLLMNHPTGTLPFVPMACATLAPGGTLHIYLRLPREAPPLPPEVAAQLPAGATLLATRGLHPYSPREDIRVLDIGV